MFRAFIFALGGSSSNNIARTPELEKTLATALGSIEKTIGSPSEIRKVEGSVNKSTTKAEGNAFSLDLNIPRSAFKFKIFL